ncbi:MAG: hypothetical protein JWM56_164 [Candidatus Peribacteria bacterium]|nr:hypothetical protein [Candidatus Peribacteria bacterium]
MNPNKMTSGQVWHEHDYLNKEITKYPDTASMLSSPDVELVKVRYTGREFRVLAVLKKRTNATRDALAALLPKTMELVLSDDSPLTVPVEIMERTEYELREEISRLPDGVRSRLQPIDQLPIDPSMFD